MFFSKMPKYVYHYFPVKALGEAPRMLLSYGGQEFEDIRVNPEQWPEYKPSEFHAHIAYYNNIVLSIDYIELSSLDFFLIHH